MAAEVISGADGAGLTLLVDGRADTIVASAPFVVAIDQVQYRLGQGPCLSAVASARTQVSACLGNDDRWPRFGPRGGRLGVHSALSAPLLIDGSVIGAFERLRPQPQLLWRGVRQSRRSIRPARGRHRGLRTGVGGKSPTAALLTRALESRMVTDYAIGIIMSRTGATPDQALAQLRELSQTTSTKLIVIAAQLVDPQSAKPIIDTDPTTD